MRFNLIVSFFLVSLLFKCKNDSIGQGNPKNIAEQIAKDPGIMVDVRTPEEWNSGHHPRAIHADWDGGQFQLESAKWDPSKTYYLYCAAGGRSSAATEYLKSKGFKKVYNLGGYNQVKNLK